MPRGLRVRHIGSYLEALINCVKAACDRWSMPVQAFAGYARRNSALKVLLALRDG